ncbi:MAG: AAA family ATPase [Lachnospiraceae bacterium]|nr:AAA family ATPase [Lachnospiraceae bacterium]
MVFDEMTEKVMQMALMNAAKRDSQLVTPEHILYVCTDVPVFIRAVHICKGSVEHIKDSLDEFLSTMLPQRKEGSVDERPIGERISDAFAGTVETAVEAAEHVHAKFISLHHIIYGITQQNESFASYYLEQEVGNLNDFLSALQMLIEGGSEYDIDEEYEDAEDYVLDFATLLNDTVNDHNPLIGRETELDRIIRILLRKEKNNPLLLGEPGVGKTSIIYGLTKRIVDGKVPDALKNARVYLLDVTELIAGTQYRGDFEKRFLDIMDALAEIEQPIVFIDEIHNLIGAGSMGSGSMDASNMMKPYLESGKIRFIGATTYDEHKRHFAKNVTLNRRFQKVDIKEPAEEEAVEILEGLRSSYERFHGVKYGKDVLAHAVKLSKNFIGGRYLPDKAIDLIDEAGAYRRMHPLAGQKRQTVGKDVIETVLAEVGNIPKATAEQSEVDRLKDLYGRITGKIFGQEEAVRRIVDAIYMSRAGLLAENKPIASFLFVGPTGVGKTEVARVLSQELGISFVRFDMSEYAERHTVSKLIGSPAGYVGYEDGGALTDAIRKTPHCVLLLDEIEKAHPDIFNVLLQVMDYASLTDNRGQKADFKNVIIIMTSNAGARMVGRQSIGFGAPKFNDSVMMEEVKRVFTPEFRNRLSAIVTFNHMNERMAAQIAQKKLDELLKQLLGRRVSVQVRPEAMEYIRTRGITREYGAREIERVIDSEIKPLFVSELLFGRLKNGGEAQLGVEEGKPCLLVGGRAAAGEKPMDEKGSKRGSRRAAAEKADAAPEEKTTPESLLAGKRRQKARVPAKKDEA